jgi:hypothetical protein
VPATSVVARTIAGTIYEDANGDASLADAVGAAGVIVRLYEDSNGDDLPNFGDAFVQMAVTNAAGQYRFTNLTNNTVYWVVVDSRTITPTAGVNGINRMDDVWAEQTYVVANNIDTGTGGSIRAVSHAAGAYSLPARFSAVRTARVPTMAPP